MEKRHYRIAIKGIVQGVSFRSLIKKRAQEFHLYGSAKNLSNGSVEVEVQGFSLDTEAFINSLKIDSGRAVIHNMQIEHLPIDQNLTEFKIIH